MEDPQPPQPNKVTGRTFWDFCTEQPDTIQTIVIALVIGACIIVYNICS